MKIGDRVKVFLSYQGIEAEGIIQDIHQVTGICEVRIPLKYGGYRTVFGYVKDCKPVNKELEDKI